MPPPKACACTYFQHTRVVDMHIMVNIIIIITLKIVFNLLTNCLWVLRHKCLHTPCPVRNSFDFCYCLYRYIRICIIIIFSYTWIDLASIVTKSIKRCKNWISEMSETKECATMPLKNCPTNDTENGKYVLLLFYSYSSIIIGSFPLERHM